MVESLANPAKVLDGIVVFAAPVLPGAKVPPAAEMKLIVECAGGKWAASVAAATKAAKGKTGALVVALPEALAADESLAAQCRELSATGPAGYPITPACIFDAVMSKNMKFESYATEPQPAGKSKRKR